MHRRLQLESVLRQAPRSLAPEGVYDPRRHRRTLTLGADHGSAQAGMASFHEAFHAELNGSTTFGLAMILAGAMAREGHSGFGDLTDRMIDCALITHETYATVSSVACLKDGAFDPLILADYPDYQGYAERFATVFALVGTPVLECIVLNACCRVAMQTDILDQWLQHPPLDWPAIVGSRDSNPDARFEHLFQAAPARAALAAVERALAQLDETGHAMGGAAAKPTFRSVNDLTGQSIDQLNRIAFAALSAELARSGAPVLAYDAQRSAASKILETLRDSGFAEVASSFVVPAAQSNDRDAFLLSFSGESVVLRPRRDLARFVHISEIDYDPAPYLVIAPHENPHLQVVAMPKAKARALYDAYEGGEWLRNDDGAMITGFRGKTGLDADDIVRIEMLCLGSPEDLEGIVGKLPGIDVVATISATSLYDEAWNRAWLRALSEHIAVLSVVIDLDPFQLAIELAQTSVISLGQIKFSRDEGGTSNDILVLLLTCAAQPGIFYFTPCSPTFVSVLAGFCVERGVTMGPNPEFPPELRRRLRFAFTHTLQEEREFGFDFWLP